MPELIVHRKNPAQPPMVCMYCGAPATVQVVADRTTEDTVVLDRVRQAYFDATGQKPAEAA